MKYLVVSTLFSAGLMLYISAGSLSAFTKVATISTIPKQENLKEATDEPSDEIATTQTAAAANSPAEEQLVQIQGKWHKYRADNRYVIDGVPTFHIAKKRPVVEVALNETKTPGRLPALTPASVPTTSKEMKTSQELLKMVGENPMMAYTPEGFQTLKAGLDALKSSNADRKKTLEALSREQ